MTFKPKTWFLLSIVLFIAAWFFWQRGEEKRNAQPVKSTTNVSAANSELLRVTATVSKTPVLLPNNLIVSETASNLVHPANPTDYRVSNTKESLDTLVLKDSALLLRNAWIDTAGKSPLPVPADLRAAQDPGSYIVQANGVITPAFRKLLSDAGATVVSYIPNNAYLVRVSADGARSLAGAPMVQAILPNEPLYKIEMGLLPEALGQRRNPAGKVLRVTIFDDLKETAMADIKNLGGVVVGHDRTPFGAQFLVQVPLGSNNTVQQLAKMNSVQGIELYRERVLLNDLTRQRVKVSVNTVTNANYLGLTGSNVLVNVNDTGAYAGHPDLSNRVFGIIITNNAGVPLVNTYEDFVGHGTHVSGIIASSGEHSPSGMVLTNFNSVSNANFRGMAPGASVFVLPFNRDLSDNLDSYSSDAGLAEWAARTNLFVFGRTNTLISNNSWGYGSQSYNSSAAIFDGAARDSLPEVPGSQPTLFIFAAGNSGSAGDLCSITEFADTINSPATMKNGIAVGAIENLRKINSTVITNLVQNSLGSNFSIYYTCNNCDFVTNNDAFLGRTDSSNQVASFSSRGNTGLNSKSIGRFKPDVVAPGTFIASTRPPGTNWNAASYYHPTNVIDGYRFNGLILKPGQTNSFPPVFVPDNSVEIAFRALPALVNSSNSVVIYASTNIPPSQDPAAYVDTNRLVITNFASSNCFGDLWFVDVVNVGSNQAVVDFTAQVLATNKGTVLTALSNINEALDPNEYYRFESGTSMAAPVVSGLAALMQEFFEQRLGRTNSPALMKALLINGARSVSSDYHLQIDPIVNQQGWGLVNIQNTIPALLNTLSNSTDEASWPIRFFEQNPTNSLSTGQSHTYAVAITNELAVHAPLRVTLVWTDPPGNPAATINLVNDLDLIITNNDTGEVFFGNNFTGGSDFSELNLITSNSVPVYFSGVTNDSINNVENVYLSAPLGTNYSITVAAKRVNVNAVTANTNDVVQDYALVISCGNTAITNAFSIAPVVLNVDTNPAVTILDIGPSDSTNSLTSHRSRGTVIESQRVGANASMLVSTNGTNLQWRFYVVTNTTTFTNALFSIFAAPTLSAGENISDPYAVSDDLGPNSGFPLGRNISADLDLFVSTNSALTNLDDTVIATAWKSVDRFSDEAVLQTNSTQGTVYYIGVKSEDQQAGEFSLGVIFTEVNPYQLNADGSVTVELPFAQYDIPDGTPTIPGAAYSIGLPAFPGRNFDIGGVVVSNQFTHQLFGDLVGLLTFGSTQIYLNNHNDFIQGQSSGTVANSYDDLNILPIAPANATTSDGPGSLADFLGKKANSSSLRFYMIDNANTFTGRVDGVLVTLFPQNTNNLLHGTSGELFSGTVGPGQSRYGALVVPAAAVKLTLKVSLPNAGEGPVDLLVRRDDGSQPRLPSTSNFDYSKIIAFPGDSLTIGRGDIPPLIAGTYLVAIHNPGSSQATFKVFFDMTLDYGESAASTLNSTNVVVVVDQTFTNSYTSTINLGLRTNQIVSDVRVGVRIDHPRVSDLSLHLVSPEGTSVLLAENRGHDSTNGFGLGSRPGEFAYTSFGEDTNYATLPIKFASNSNFLEFIPPVLLATNVLEDTTNQPSITRTAGQMQEDWNIILTGTNAGSITVSWDFLGIADQMRIYYQGVLIFDTGVVSGTGTATVAYSGTAEELEIVMNEGGGASSGTGWSYTYTLTPPPPANPFHNGKATGVTISGNSLYFSGITDASATNGIVGRLALPMQNDAFPVWEVGWPDMKGGTRLNGISVAGGNAFVAGSSYTLTMDDRADGQKQTKGITAAFPTTAPITNQFDVYGSLWHVQTPTTAVFTNVGGLEQLHAITAMADANTNAIYVTGDAQANTTNFGRLFISKLNTNGVVMWTTNDAPAGVTTNYSSGRAIAVLSTNIYVAGANADSGVTNMYLVKFDGDGNRLWSKISTAAGEFRGMAVYGDYIYTVGSINNGAVTNCFVQKWDESGTSIWTNQFNINNNDDVLNCVVGYGDRLYAAGYTTTPTQGRNALLLEISQATGLLITNTSGYLGKTEYEGGVSGDDSVNSIATDGFDLYLVGETHRKLTSPDSDVLILRYQIKKDYLPEEPLSVFTGESVNSVMTGTNLNGWRLVIWDNRADSISSTGRLLGWQLQLTLAPTNNTPDILVHDTPFIGTATAKNPTRYFIVNVPYTAAKATIGLTNSVGANAHLWYSDHGLPVPGDRTLLLSNIVADAVTLDTLTTVPELIPGRRFYLAVEYLGTGTDEFLIQVAFDSSATTFMTGGSSTSGSVGSSAGAHSLYQFVINPSAPPTAFQLRNLTGNAEVYLRRGNVPDTGHYDFHQTFIGTNFGQTIIQPGGSLPDVSGTWFATVGNLSASPISYTVVVTNANRSPVFGAVGTKAAEEGSLLSFTVPVTDPDAPDQQVSFALEPGAPVGAAINSSNGVFSWTPTASQGPSSNVVTIRVTDNGVPPITVTQNISIIVNDKVPVFAAPAVVSGKLQITWSSLSGQNYQVQTSTNLVDWTTISTNSASGLSTTYLDPDPQTNSVHKFYRVRTVP